MGYKERRELNDELMSYVADFGDAFEDLINALEEMERVNDELLKVNVEHNEYMKHVQNKAYNFNSNLISRIKEAING